MSRVKSKVHSEERLISNKNIHQQKSKGRQKDSVLNEKTQPCNDRKCFRDFFPFYWKNLFVSVSTLFNECSLKKIRIRLGKRQETRVLETISLRRKIQKDKNTNCALMARNLFFMITMTRTR